MSQLPPLPQFRLDGRQALVTGASRGIGLAAAAALAGVGAEVTLVARSEPALESACAAIRARGGRCHRLVLDVTDPAAVDSALAERGPFQVLVNNAGMNRPLTLAELSPEDLDAIFDLNVKSAFYVSRAVTRALTAAGLPGSIINVSSQMGHVGGPRRTMYCASKHALEGMTKALAWELGRQAIRVNTLCPTFLETDMTRAMFAEPTFRNWVLERIALGRLGQLEDIGGAIVFLASDASSLVTGSALMLDGGWTAA
jgi:NAD(P)-dependent dehydrogenase (short-subunit alcohol dehydrogenase family)